MYQRIFKHYGFLAQRDQYSFRIVGFSGTPFRDKNISIVGEHAFFKEEVCNITTAFLISQGYLTKPYFGITHSDSFNFKKVKIENTGKFNQKQLQTVVDENMRLTGKIMLELQQIECNGMFIFCSSIPHCFESLKWLPQHNSAVIIGATPHKERQEILMKAQSGEIKHLISVSILMVGIDIPLYDYCAWLRPTESLILFIQGIGRILRLHPTKNKAVVLDFAGNLDRFQDIDDPLINEAIQPIDPDDPDYCIQCYTCNTMNSVNNRRCRGILNNKRCDHYFEWKDCHSCSKKTDITSRYCPHCQAELIDPNAKLKRQPAVTFELKVTKATYFTRAYGPHPQVHAEYQCGRAKVYELYQTNTERTRNIFYAKFCRIHLANASKYYPHLTNAVKVQELLEKANTPHTLTCSFDNHKRIVIKKKHFATLT